MTPKPTSSTEVASAPQSAIENFAFAPTTLTVAVGTTVTWVNHDDDLHTVTFSDSLFSSPGEVPYVQGQSPLAIVDSTLV
jgi:plastocyanin